MTKEIIYILFFIILKDVIIQFDKFTLKYYFEMLHLHETLINYERINIKNIIVFIKY